MREQEVTTGGLGVGLVRTAATHGSADLYVAAVDVETMTVSELLGGYARILAELRRRGTVRTKNAPVGDYAELLVATALGGTLAASTSEKSYDLTAPSWGKIQVKARVVEVPVSRSDAQTSPIRSWDFDFAAFVQVLLDDYSVHRAVLVPVGLLRTMVRASSANGGFVAWMQGDLLDGPDVIDITEKVRASADLV